MAVSNGHGNINRYSFTCLARQLVIVACIGFNPKNLNVGIQIFRNSRRTRQQAATAEADDSHVTPGFIGEGFEHGGALASHHRWVVIRLDQHPPFAFAQLGTDVLAALGVPVIGDDLGAIPPGCCQLVRRCIGGHHDFGRYAQQVRSERHALCMIS